MNPITYASVLRDYGATLRADLADTDLTPRARRVAAVVIATASNDGASSNAYGAVHDDVAIREAIIARTANLLWNGNARAFMMAASGGRAQAERDIEAGIERGFTILRNI